MSANWTTLFRGGLLACPQCRAWILVPSDLKYLVMCWCGQSFRVKPEEMKDPQKLFTQKEKQA